MEFYQRLNSLMEEFGYTNYRVAKLLDCHQSAVANWVSGKNIPQKHTIAKLADLFSVSVEYLKGETNDRGETKKAPTENGERSNDKLSMLVSLFERLPPEEQNDVIFQLLSRAQAQLDQDGRK